MIKTNFKTTIRTENIKLQKNQFKLDDSEMDKMLDKHIPTQRHLKLIYYYIYEYNWSKAKSFVFYLYYTHFLH